MMINIETTQQLPIPVESGFQAYFDAMRGRGMDDKQIYGIANGTVQFLAEGFTGVKMSDDYALKDKK